MKIVTPNNFPIKKISLSLLALLAILIVGYTTYAGVSSSWPFSSGASSVPELNPEPAQDSSGSAPVSEEYSNTPTTQDSSPTDKTPVPYDTPEGSSATQNTLTGVINHSSVSGGNLVIRNTINQNISSGNCKLTLYNQSTNKTVTKTAEIAPGPHASTCQGFTVPISELSSGVWDITITVTSGDKKGTLEDSLEI